MKRTKPIKSGKDYSFEWNQFCKLGEMLGDGLGDEEGGEWIKKEYKKLMYLLTPEVKEEEQRRNKIKINKTNSQMVPLLNDKKCKCGGSIKQSRSGSLRCECIVCGQGYTAKRTK